MSETAPVAGDVAPDFTLPDHTGTDVKLSSLRGRKVVLYFYPKDDTPGCTTQACQLRDSMAEFDARDVLVYGISPDPVTAHERFRAKFSLPFPLLADTDHAVAERYGVWKEKSLYGRTYWGVERTTYVIDEQGRVQQVLPRVKPAEHVARVLAAL